MKYSYLASAALFFSAAMALPAHAGSFDFKFNGSGVNGSIQLTYAANPNTGVLPGTSPNPVDPIGSFIITGITGTFADANIGLASTAITGIVLSDPAHPDDTNLLAPASFGFYDVASGIPTPSGGVAPGFSYDGLFYPDGSPQTATDYPFHGGFFDIYGIVFTTASGHAVNFWSNGDFGGGATYGAGVTDGLTVLDYAGDINVAAGPEPATWARMCGRFWQRGHT